MTLHQAAALAAASSGQQIRRAYERAIWQGAANTCSSDEHERTRGPLRLLTLALLRLPDLTLLAHLAQAYEIEDDDGPSSRAAVVVLGGVVDHATGALGLAHRALETHGRELSYEIEAWVELASRRALEQLAAARDVAGVEQDPEIAVTVEQARLAHVALARAAAATEGDPLVVADQIAHAAGHLLAVYLVAREAGGG